MRRIQYWKVDSNMCLADGSNVLPGHPLIWKHDFVLHDGETFWVTVCVRESDDWWREEVASREILCSNFALCFKMPKIFRVISITTTTQTHTKNQNEIVINKEFHYGALWSNRDRGNHVLPLRRGAKGEKEVEWWRRNWWWEIWRGRVLDYSFSGSSWTDLRSKFNESWKTKDFSSQMIR